MPGTCETVLFDGQYVQVIVDNHNKNVYLAIDGRAIAKRDRDGWSIVARGCMEPNWVPLDDVFKTEGATQDERMTDD